jgi:CBS domain-containing protein
MNTDVVAVHAEDDVESLLRVLREHELPGVAVPVVDQDGKPLGVVTRVAVLESLAG